MNKKQILHLSSLLLLAGATSLRAGNDTWVGNTSANWNDANWSGANNPPATGDSLFFGAAGSSGTALNNNSPATSFAGLTFNVSAPAYTFSGSSLPLGGSIVDNASSTETLNLPIALSASQNINVVSGGNLTIGGVISGTGFGLTNIGPGTLDLNGSAVNTYTGPTVVNAGTVLEDFSSLGATANLISSSSALVLGGGTFQINGNSSNPSIQTNNGATVNPGFNVISLGNNSPTLVLGAFTQALGSQTEFIGPAYNNNVTGGTVNTVPATGTIKTTTVGLQTSLLWPATRSAVATVGLYNWASVPLTGSVNNISSGDQVSGFYTTIGSGTTTSADNNLDITGNLSLKSGGYNDTLRFNTATTLTATVGGSANYTTCGILLTPNVGSHNVTFDFGTHWFKGNNGSGTATDAIVVYQNNTGGELIFQDGSMVNYSATIPTAYVQAGAGTVVMNSTLIAATSSPYSYSGGTYLNGGVTEIYGDAGLGNLTTGTTVNLNGGTLLGAATFNLDNAGANKRTIALGSVGGGLAAVAGTTLTIDGQLTGVAGQGPLVIGIPASSANGSVSGQVPGTGSGLANAQVLATGTVALTYPSAAAGNSFYGGVNIVGGATLNINSEYALGGANYGGLTFNGGTLQYNTTPATGTAGLFEDITGNSATPSVAQAVTLAGNATIDLNGNTIVYTNTLGNGGSGQLTVASTAGSGRLLLNGGSTHLGGTIVNSGVKLGGSGTLAGNVTVNSGGETFPSTGNGATTTIGGSLTYSAGALAGFNLSAAYNGANDQVIVTGALNLNGTVAVHIKAPSTLAPLDTSADYVLLTYGSISGSGSFSSAVNWDVQPSNYNSYSISNDTVHQEILLHFTPSAAPPTLTGSASPATVVRNQSTLISATVTPGSGTVSSSGSAFLNASSVGLSSSVPLTLSATPNVYTNTITIPAGAGTGSFNLGIWVVDSTPLTGTNNFSLTINSTTETWNGGDFGTSGNWSDNGNWASGLAPGLAGDTLVFDGRAGPTPNLDNNYSVTSVNFPSTAGSFTIGTSDSSSLTVSVGVTNNSGNAQTLNVPVTLAAPATLDAAAGALTLGSNVTNGGNLLTITDGGNNTTISGAVSGAGGLTMAGTGTAALAGVNTFAGNTAISSGTLAINGSGQLGSGSYAGNITNTGTFNYNSSASQTLSGVVSSTGALVKNGSGILTLTAANTFSGNVTVNNGTLVAATTVNGTGGGAGPLGNGAINTRTITVNGPGILDLQINNVFGQLSAPGGGKNTTPPPIVINGGVLQCEKVSDLVGAITLNGGTLLANTTSANLNYAPSSGYTNAYLSFQLGGTVTVIGSSPSFINNSQSSFATAQDGISLTNGATTFIVADVTGNPNVDLTVQAAIGDVNNDYAPTGNKTPCQLVKDGPGTMLLSGLNFYDGGTIVSAGTLVAGTTDGQALPSGGTPNFAGLANAAGAFGKPGTVIFLGDTNTSASPSLVIGGPFTVGHPIVVTNLATTGTYSIGGSTDTNATFSGAIKVNEPLTISQVANAVGNALTLSGGITSGGGSQTLTFAGPGNIDVTTTPIANGSGTLAVAVTGGTLTLSAGNTYTGNTIISAGTLALSGSGSLASANISVAGTLDASSASLSLASGQTLTNSASATGTLKGGVTTGSGTVSLSYSGSSTPSFTVASGTLTLSSGTTFLVDNTSGTALAHGSYKLISSTGGSVAASGALPSVTVGGSGFVGGELAYLNLLGGELYLEINQPPVAANNTYTRNGLSSWKIPVSNLLTNATSPDGDTLTLASVGASTNGAAVTISGGWVGYSNPNLVDDQFTYTVTDSFGGSSTGTITLTVGSAAPSNGMATSIAVSGGTASMSFAGIPNYTYYVQRSTDLSNWVSISTNTAPSNGVFQFTDTNAPAGSADYRLEWPGN